ncbi:MFS transporter [Lichenifustis flavocetrariae]|uniref:MFS transporter n=1 Tax=Lichenifustis flavocetrariae TaxID=2949735 RepID=A0AA42CPB5_9HYPH|nr:MFS transporter [Lichenifustis flavocetrariae]MCW6510235.1 MFS transporter [Lichenifustis flavocetrariae]
MSEYAERTWAPAAEQQASWPAVFSLTLGVFGLVTAEFLPASLLTPIARALDIPEALAGQAVTATAIVAFFAGLLAAVVTRGLDRRRVLMGFSTLLILSNLLVAAAPNLPLLLLARVLLGIALGGFWSMATAVTIRLVPPALVPRALSLVFSGVSVATIVAVPLGSYIGGLYGWRVVFLLSAGIGLVTLVIQMATLPRLADLGAARLGTLLSVLQRPGIGLGIACVVLVFSGHFALFTYVRPFLESVGGTDVSGIALTLLGFGLANFAGTLLAGFLLERSLRLTLALMPLLIAAAGLGLTGLHAGLPLQALLVALWGLAFGTIPVAWSTWLARAVPDETETGGGLIVAAVQLAITFGAAGGGAIYALAGVAGVFATGGALMVATSAIILASISASKPA